MAGAWRIDALDPRGGLTFVSWREETLFADAPLEEAPVFFIGAPSFTPQPVANRGVALAAERHGFQLGLLDAEGEVPFETLGDVAEFVRRLYLASARGDTSDPGAATPLPLPRPSPPDEPPPAELVERFRAGPLADAVSRFLALSELLERGVAAPIVWRDMIAAFEGGGRVSAAERLSHGAAVLFRELLIRFPSPFDPEALERWRVSAATFVAIVRRLDLWPKLTEDTSLQAPSVQFLTQAWSQIETLPDELQAENATYLALQAMAQQTIHEDWAFWEGATGFSNPLEPMEELARLPIPAALAAAIGATEASRASVATLLSCTLGSPKAIVETTDADAVLLFGACRVVAVDGALFTASRSYPWEARNWDRVTMDFRRGRMLRTAAEWLAENLPRIAFEGALEEMIAGGADATVYRDPGDGSDGGGGARKRRWSSDPHAGSASTYAQPAQRQQYGASG